MAAYGLEERSAHTPDEVDWEALPDRCALQLHWRRTPEFRKTLKRYGFSVAVLARHPLDVLVSILHFAPHEPQTARWLDGEGGDETRCSGPIRRHPRFSPTPPARARRRCWRSRPSGGRMRTRARSTRASSTMRRASSAGSSQALGESPLVTPARAVEAVSFGRLREEATNEHFWQGRAGLWTELVPTRYALDIASAHPEMLRLGYSVGVDAPTARARWSAIAEAS